MENAIISNPLKYIGEKGLKFVSQQFHIGKYYFDLLFEDRHGGKLIVELQKGTLDRDHTYKILDYYDEYKESHPDEFIDLIKNQKNQFVKALTDYDPNIIIKMDWKDLSEYNLRHKINWFIMFYPSSWEISPSQVSGVHFSFIYFIDKKTLAEYVRPQLSEKQFLQWNIFLMVGQFRKLQASF